MTNYAICIPTYKRTVLPSLNLLKDSTVELNYFVREEELASGFYDFLKPIPRVNIVSLGKNVVDIGDTRQRILDWCDVHKVSYCVMLDDGVDDIWFARDVNRTLHDVIIQALVLVEYSAYGDKCVGMGLSKKRAIFGDGTKRDIKFSTITPREYLAFTPTQAVILDVKRCFKHGLRYGLLKDVGFEDCAFYVDALKRGCVFVTPDDVCFSAVVPNSVKAGGNHTTSESIEAKYDRQALQCVKYLGNMYGIGLSKRYRSYADAFLTMVEVDNDYFWECLIKSPKKNAKIIEKQFTFKTKCDTI